MCDMGPLAVFPNEDVGNEREAVISRSFVRGTRNTETPL